MSCFELVAESQLAVLSAIDWGEKRPSFTILLCNNLMSIFVDAVSLANQFFDSAQGWVLLLQLVGINADSANRNWLPGELGSVGTVFPCSSDKNSQL